MPCLCYAYFLSTLLPFGHGHLHFAIVLWQYGTLDWSHHKTANSCLLPDGSGCLYSTGTGQDNWEHFQEGKDTDDWDCCDSSGEDLPGASHNITSFVLGPLTEAFEMFTLFSGVSNTYV